MRTLAVGGRISLPIENRSWAESWNIKDYDLCFLDLDRLSKMLKTTEISESDVHLPDSGDVATALQAGSNIYVTLPIYNIINMSGWLPFKIRLDYESGQSIDTKTVDDEWKWYFSEDSGWNVIVSNVHLLSSFSRRKRSVDIIPLAENRYGGILGGEIVKYQSGAFLSKSKVWEGKLVLLPLLEGDTFDRLVREIANRFYGISAVDSKDEDVPEWLSEYTLPEEEIVLKRVRELRQELENTQSQLKGVKKYKELLYENGRTLEDIVLDAFAEFGYETEGEVEGKRDGLLHVDGFYFVIETYGTTSGITLDKCRQLNDWVDQALVEHTDKEIEGLLVANPMRREDPTQRGDGISSEVENYMRRRGYKIMTAINLYKILKGYQEGKFSKEDVTDYLLDDNVVVNVTDVSITD